MLRHFLIFGIFLSARCSQAGIPETYRTTYSNINKIRIKNADEYSQSLTLAQHKYTAPLNFHPETQSLNMNTNRQVADKYPLCFYLAQDEYPTQHFRELFHQLT